MSLQEPSITFSAFVPSAGNGFMVILYVSTGSCNDAGSAIDDSKVVRSDYRQYRAPG